MNDDSAELVISGDPQAQASVGALAAALVEAERTIIERGPERVLVADDSDLALAAALAATKLELPLAATEAARNPSTSNGRLIAQLALDLDSAR
jgi:UDP-N-acetylglucosamine 2-epimerase